MRLSSAQIALSAALAIFVLSGCGTIFHGTNQDVTVASDPGGAQVYESGRLIGVTPATLDLKRKDDYILTLRLEGYREAEVYIQNTIDPVPLVANLVTVPLGLALDLANGAAYVLDPSDIYVQLEEDGENEDAVAAPAPPLAVVPNGPRRQNGPRFGVTYLSPGVVDRINEVLDDGSGDDVINTPLVTQFGWQFEVQTFQAESGLTGVVEFVPLIGGLERGRFFPTFTLIAGARTVDGFELGVGPNLSLTGLGNIENSNNEAGIAAGLAIAAGKSFDVGGANIPLNAAIVMGQSGARLSLLIGLTTSSGRY